MQLSDFDFDLPERLIATRPARPRTSARLLVSDGDAIHDAVVRDLTDWLRPGDRLVLNDTRVIPARLSGIRARDTAQGPTEARIEATLLEPRPGGHWAALLKPLKKVKEGEVIRFSDALSATLLSKEDGQGVLEFNLTGEDFDQALAEAGAMPLPPYIAALRAPDDADKTDYQTVWAEKSGAVAAPTASLHFDRDLLDSAHESFRALRDTNGRAQVAFWLAQLSRQLNNLDAAADYYRESMGLTEKESRLGVQVIAVGNITVGGTDLFDAFSSNDAFFRAPYLLGAASLLCVAILFRTSAKHIRACAFMLGTSAGAPCLLGWLAQHG